MIGKRRNIIIGVITGILLASFLKITQSLTGIKVYTLLLNVDFIPFLNQIPSIELLELVYHLIISVIIVFLLDFCKKNLSVKRLYVYGFIFIFTSFLYLPLSQLAIQDVPKSTDLVAICWWIFGHLLYTIVLYISFENKKSGRAAFS